QSDATETSEYERQFAVDLGLCRDLAGAFGIDFGQHLEILVQRGADGAVGVIVAPFASRRGADLVGSAHQFLAEIDELLDALLESGELLGVVGLDDAFPFPHHVEDSAVELEQALAEFPNWFGTVRM